ncbi:ABC transporter permease [Bifidobacterium leontopitheci]|uniref:ABC transporter permease n=1 Tax=Bifidobacterium leontopitheci TaxID=2650774 RepID=A0A6I1GLW9_9BIFI|nr:ABC transporter permease [Bifidobacterium leontopitheci]KAB7790586.1 ABC transporter permease [Bifidobacterium leontopitheci]
MTNTALLLVRLRWTLTLATVRRSPWQMVGFILGLLIAVLAVAGTGPAAWFVGDLPAFHPSGPGVLDANYGFVRITTVTLGTMITAMAAFIQLMMIGEGTTMSPARFALYGIPDRKLHSGLLLATLTGIPSICGLLAFALWSLAYRGMGVAAVVNGVLAAVLAIVTTVSVARLLISLSTSLVRSRRGKNTFYAVVLLLFIVICQLPNLFVNTSDLAQDSSAMRGAAAGRFATVLSWTPFGAAFQLPFDVATGDWVMFAARLVLLAVTCTVCFLLCVWCLRHDRLTAGAASAAVTVKGVGAFGWMPDSVSGAVSARLLTYLRRDPRQAMLFVMPVIFLVMFSLQAHGESGMVWQTLIWSAWMMSIAESNGLAYDGPGFTMEVLAGVRGFSDRAGRVRVYLAIIVGYLLMLSVAIVLITGDWRRPDALLVGAVMLAVALGVGCSALGIAQVTSCTLMYPVASLDKPFSAPQGRALAQGFFPFVYLFGGFLLMLPTGGVAVGLLAAHVFLEWYWLLIPVALANGAVALWLGTWLGGKLVDARAIDIVRTLDSFASLQR